MRSGTVVVVAPVSGPRAAWGALLPDDLRTRRDVSVVDDAGDPERSAAIADAVAASEDVYGVVGHFSSRGATLARARYALAACPVTFPLASADLVVQHHRSRSTGVLAPMPSDAAQVRAIQDVIAAADGTAAVLGLSPWSSIVSAWRRRGVRVHHPLAPIPRAASHVVVAGDLDAALAARRRLAALAGEGRTLVLTDDIGPGAERVVDAVTQDVGDAAVTVMAASMSARDLLDVACTHMLAARDAALGPDAFVETWPVDTALSWVCRRMTGTADG